MAHELRVGQYHFFITQLPYVSPLMFRLATQQNGATRAVAGAEKSAFAWCAVCGAVVCVCVGGVWWWCVGEGRCSAVRWGGAVEVHSTCRSGPQVCASAESNPRP